MNPIDNEKEFKFKIDDHVRISKYKNIFAKVYIPKKFLWWKKLTIPFRGTISDLHGE